MSIQYAGGSRVNYTFTDAGTRADLVSKLNTQLKTAGWTAISGDGTGDVLMESATTPDGLKIRFRLYDPGAGNCAQFTMKNTAGTLTSQIFYLLPASAEWRIVANKYQFWMFRTGSANRNASRGVLMGGTIWVPSFVLSLMGSDKECGWVEGNGASDTTQINNHHRVRIGFYSPSGTDIRVSTLWTSFLLNYANNNNGRLRLMSNYAPAYGNIPAFWQDGSCIQIEAVVAWVPADVATVAGKYKGQLWDGMVIPALQVNGETTISFDGHTFLAITDQCTVDSESMGTLYIAVD